MCIEPGCTVKRGIFNYPGEKKGIYCSQHKLEGMRDIKHPTCAHPDCLIRPGYNYPGLKKSIYCSQHKLEGMKDIIHTTCAHPNCSIQPNYNYPGLKKSIYCSQHKLEGMQDIVSKTCDYPNCSIHPVFNYPGLKKRLYCSQHKLEGMKDIIHTTCKTSMCPTQPGTRYDGYCLRCFMFTFPDKPVVRGYKTKESATAQHVLSEFPNFDWVADKRVQDGCSRRRPDMLLDFGSHAIIIEIDENQHRAYDCSCENRRLMEISQDLGHRPIVFIRFNPDSYRDETGKTISSCWRITPKTGVCAVMKTKQTEWQNRLATLTDQIRYWSEHQTTKTVEVVELFYDRVFYNTSDSSSTSGSSDIADLSAFERLVIN